MNIFIYGILADESMLFLVMRIGVRLRPATLPDHEETRSSAGLPTIRSCPGASVKGLVATGVSLGWLRRLDGYYGPGYRREEVVVEADGTNLPAQTHALRSEAATGEGIIDSLEPSAIRRSGRSRPQNPGWCCGPGTRI